MEHEEMLGVYGCFSMQSGDMSRFGLLIKVLEEV